MRKHLVVNMFESMASYEDEPPPTFAKYESHDNTIITIILTFLVTSAIIKVSRQRENTKMTLNYFVAALGLLAPASALLRFPCSQLTVQRLDPLVNPGQNPSAHIHQVVGGVSVSLADTV